MKKSVGLLILVATILPCKGQKLFDAELQLPVKGISQRVTQRPYLKEGETHVLFDQQGPGSLSHWWLTCNHGKNEKTGLDWAHQLQLRFFYDGEIEPAVEMTLARFFGILLENDVYTIDHAAIRVLPKNAFNCYFPIPFRQLRIEVQNLGPGDMSIWFMGDWQKYPDETLITPYRLIAIFNREAPAERFGSIQMADLEGMGFLAGMIQAVKIMDESDAWYHTGGETFLIDGETDPVVIRGIGGEDVFNMSFGIWPVQTQWVGAPLTIGEGEENSLGSDFDGVMYRIFGPDPIHFKTSASLRFGTKKNTTESLIYAYMEPGEAPEILTPSEWHTAGPFECKTFEDFLKKEWAEDGQEKWPVEHVADFGVYIIRLKGMPEKPAVFSVPLKLEYEHGWCDFVRNYRGRGRTNMGAQPVDASAYAAGRMEIPRRGTYDLVVGYDDWIRIWIDGKEVYSGRHDNGFNVERIELELPKGEVDILVKLSNFDNMQWRNWAFSMRFE